MNQEESEQCEVDGMKKGADSTGKVMHNRPVISLMHVVCNIIHAKVGLDLL